MALEISAPLIDIIFDKATSSDADAYVYHPDGYAEFRRIPGDISKSLAVAVLARISGLSVDDFLSQCKKMGKMVCIDESLWPALNIKVTLYCENGLKLSPGECASVRTVTGTHLGDEALLGAVPLNAGKFESIITDAFRRAVPTTGSDLNTYWVILPEHKSSPTNATAVIRSRAGACTIVTAPSALQVFRDKFEQHTELPAWLSESECPPMLMCDSIDDNSVCLRDANALWRQFQLYCNTEEPVQLVSSVIGVGHAWQPKTWDFVVGCVYNVESQNPLILRGNVSEATNEQLKHKEIAQEDPDAYSAVDVLKCTSVNGNIVRFRSVAYPAPEIILDYKYRTPVRIKDNSTGQVCEWLPGEKGFVENVDYKVLSRDPWVLYGPVAHHLHEAQLNRRKLNALTDAVMRINPECSTVPEAVRLAQLLWLEYADNFDKCNNTVEFKSALRDMLSVALNRACACTGRKKKLELSRRARLLACLLPTKQSDALIDPCLREELPGAMHIEEDRQKRWVIMVGGQTLDDWIEENRSPSTGISINQEHKVSFEFSIPGNSLQNWSATKRQSNAVTAQITIGGK